MSEFAVFFCDSIREKHMDRYGSKYLRLCMGLKMKDG